MGCPGRNLSEAEAVCAGSPPLHSPSPEPFPAQAAVMSPCAACKILRRKCGKKCLLAPYFPPTEPTKFTVVHRVFGASNIIKSLQELPESQRADAVTSMVYEASARIRDPIYGCAGAVCQLQSQMNELQAELAKARAEISGMLAQHAHLMSLVCVDMDRRPSPSWSTEQSVDSYIPQADMEAHQLSFIDHWPAQYGSPFGPDRVSLILG